VLRNQAQHGFSEVRFIDAPSTVEVNDAIARGKIDFNLHFASQFVSATIENKRGRRPAATSCVECPPQVISSNPSRAPRRRIKYVIALTFCL
jgi:hypothetical protein